MGWLLCEREAQLEAFAVAVRKGLDTIDFEGRQRLVRLLIERVVAPGEHVTIEHAVPLSGRFCRLRKNDAGRVGLREKIIRALWNCHLFRPMTLKEVKALCLALRESMVRKHEVARKVARPFRLRLYAVKTRLAKGSLLLHIPFLVSSKKKRMDIILGCLDARVERMLKPYQRDPLAD